MSERARPPAKGGLQAGTRSLPDAVDEDADFHAPLFDEPLDVAEHIERTPVTSSVKGFIISDLVNVAVRAGIELFPDKKWVAFKDYPTRELMSVEVEIARALHPRAHLRQALRLLGHTVYPTFVQSLVGKTLFSFAGDQLGLALRLCDRAYQVAGKPARAELISYTEGRAVIRHSQQFNFLDCHQVGVFEGAMTAFNERGQVRSRRIGPASADFEITWEKRR